MFTSKKNKTKKFLNLFFSIFLLAIIFFVYFYNLLVSYQPEHDFGRDMNDILDICQGHFTLLGPKLSFGGLHIAPYYYYLFAIIYFLSKSIDVVILSNTFLFFITWTFIFYIFSKKDFKFLNENIKQRSKKSDKNFYKDTDFYSILFLFFWIATSKYFIFSARNIGNGFTYLSFLVLWIMAFLYVKKYKFTDFLLGFFLGIIINFHFVVSIFAFSFILVNTFFYIKKKQLKRLFLFLIFFGSGIVLTFSPLVLFEIKHDFVMFKNTFIDKSYKNFVQNKNLTDPLETSGNFFINFYLLSKYISQWISVPFLLIFFISLFLFIKKYKKLTQTEKIFISSSFLSFFIFVFTARYQIAYHYFFPFILFIQISLFIVIKKTYLFKFIPVLCLLNFIYFPGYLYKQRIKNIYTIKKMATSFKQSDMGDFLKDKSFSIYLLNDSLLSVHGEEYRFFLRTVGYSVNPVNRYAETSLLLVIKEKFCKSCLNQNALDRKSLEIIQFKKQKSPSLIKRYETKNFIFELYER